MWDIAGSSQDDAVSRCSRACCSRRAWVVPLVFRKAEPDDSISPPTSDSIRFAKSVDRQLHCKSHGGGWSIQQEKECGCDIGSMDLVKKPIVFGIDNRCA